MEELPPGSGLEYEERIARVVWAAHILSYLTKTRSHIELQQPDAAEEEEELDCSELDADTERTVVLQSPRESILTKFLDCIAQLLSRHKGWESVTATALRERGDFVEIDVARNDCFGIARNNGPGEHVYEFGRAEAEYCRKLGDYLSTGSHQTPLSEFELIAIDYTGRRVDYWVEQLQSILGSISATDWDERRWPENHPAVETWTNFTKLLYRGYIEATEFRGQIVQQAYECVVSTEVHRLLHMAFEIKIGPKLWQALKFLARPVTDCRILRDIASRQPQFQNVRIFPAPPFPKTGVNPKYQIDIFEAWARLISASLPASDVEMIATFSEQFRRDCAESYSLHAEMQLFMHYEDNPALTPTVYYFGCSKKACLLCDGFLQSLLSPIATRGRHGICYPAWGVPPSRSVGAETALKELEKMLVSRIKTHLHSPVRARKTHFAPPVPQSTFVSEFSNLTLEDLLQREERVESAKKSEIELREEQAILEGVGLTSQPTDRPLSNFEPHDSCVMCNKNPAKRCKQCYSCYYCSSQCQKSDWPSHKLLCKKFSSQIPRPSQNHRRAILFPVDRTNPQMIWIPCELKYSSEDEYGGGTPYEDINLHPHLGTDRPGVGITRIEHNPIRNRNLGSGMVYWAPHKEGYSVSLQYRENFLKDGSAVNRSILASVGRAGIIPHRWCGPIVAVRETPFEFHEDITLGDFRHIIDYVISYGTTELRESTNHMEARRSTTIRGVKICCFGEKKLHGCEPYVSVDVPRGHPTRLTYDAGTVSPISTLLGMPLKLWKYPDIDTWVDPPGWDASMTADSNQDAAFLMIETDPEKPGWGWAPLYWTIDLGNVLATRKDTKDLAVDDVRMMCYFARRKLQLMFEDALGGGFVSRTKQEVLDFITWENMMKCKQEMVEESGDF